MQTRKLVKIGNSIHVSIPTDYLVSMELKEGNMIVMGLSEGRNLIMWNPLHTHEPPTKDR